MRQKTFRLGVEETLNYMVYPREHWTRLRSNNMLERIMKEIRLRTRVVGAFPDGHSALMLVAPRLRHASGTKWGARRYLDIDRLHVSPSAETDLLTSEASYDDFLRYRGHGPYISRESKPMLEKQCAQLDGHYQHNI